jgi:hypothetical protein
MGNRCSNCGQVEEYKDDDYMCGDENQHFLCDDCREEWNYYKVRRVCPNACLECDDIHWGTIMRRIKLNNQFNKRFKN